MTKLWKRIYKRNKKDVKEFFTWERNPSPIANVSAPTYTLHGGGAVAPDANNKPITIAPGSTDTVPSSISVYTAEYDTVNVDSESSGLIDKINSGAVAFIAKQSELLRKDGLKKESEINQQLDSSEEIAKKANADVLMQARLDEYNEKYREVQEYNDKIRIANHKKLTDHLKGLGVTWEELTNNGAVKGGSGAVTITPIGNYQLIGSSNIGKYRIRDVAPHPNASGPFRLVKKKGGTEVQNAIVVGSRIFDTEEGVKELPGMPSDLARWEMSKMSQGFGDSDFNPDFNEFNQDIDSSWDINDPKLRALLGLDSVLVAGPDDIGYKNLKNPVFDIGRKYIFNLGKNKPFTEKDLNQAQIKEIHRQVVNNLMYSAGGGVVHQSSTNETAPAAINITNSLSAQQRLKYNLKPGYRIYQVGTYVPQRDRNKIVKYRNKKIPASSFKELRYLFGNYIAIVNEKGQLIEIRDDFDFNYGKVLIRVGSVPGDRIGETDIVQKGSGMGHSSGEVKGTASNELGIGAGDPSFVNVGRSFVNTAVNTLGLGSPVPIHIRFPNRKKVNESLFKRLGNI